MNTTKQQYVWTKDKPTAPGWYWVEEQGQPAAIIEICEDSPGDFCAIVPLYGEHPDYKWVRISLDAFTRFAGPIGSAQEPTE